MTTLLRLNPDTVTPEPGAPAPERLLDGAPRFLSWDIEARGDIYAGVWETTPGEWRMDYAEWEYCRILSGHSIITGDDGTVLDVRAGDSFLIRPGFRGTWRCVETTRKDYVIIANPDA
jgi:uncharacterized cupin superfamily protein